MVSQAHIDFARAVDGAELLWQLRAAAVRDYHRARREARSAANPTDKMLSSEAAAAALQRRDALIQAAHVRVVTAWEVFVQDLVVEYLSINKAAFKSVWGFQGTKKTPYGELLTTIHRRPFQNPDSAKNTVKKYLGKDVFGKAAKTGVDLAPIKQALVLRHAIVHRGGASTSEMRTKLRSGRQTAHSYLSSAPLGTAGIPATHFERLKIGVVAAANTLDARAWQSPPRPD